MMTKRDKIQFLIISHLKEHGSIQINLPDQVMLEIGIERLDKWGKIEKNENYCYVTASKDDKSTILDSFNLGLIFPENERTIVLDDVDINIDGLSTRRLHVV